MGNWIHRVSDVDPDARRATCAACGPTTVRKRSDGGWRCNNNPVDKRRGGKWSKEPRQRWPSFRNAYRKTMRPLCDRCGFVPEHLSQLDVDHKDDNWKNNDPSNVWTLCANCHRLVTHLRRQATKSPAAQVMAT